MAVALLLAMTGCSGGGGSEGAGAPPPRGGFFPGGESPLAGNWSGSATDTTTGQVLVATALIDDSGDAQLIVVPAITIIRPVPSASDAGLISAFGTAAPFFVVHGNLCCEANFQGTASAEPMGTGIKSTSQIIGGLSSGMLVGTFDFDGRPYSFSLAPNPTYNRALTLQDLAGVYTNTLPDLFGGATTTYTIAVSADGVVTGAHVNGCIYNGAVSIPDTSRNLFRLNMQLSNCNTANGSFGPRNGEYSGLGVLYRDAVVATDPTTIRQIFYYSLIGPVWLGTQGAQR